MCTRTVEISIYILILFCRGPAAVDHLHGRITALALLTAPIPTEGPEPIIIMLRRAGHLRYPVPAERTRELRPRHSVPRSPRICSGTWRASLDVRMRLCSGVARCEKCSRGAGVDRKRTR